MPGWSQNSSQEWGASERGQPQQQQQQPQQQQPQQQQNYNRQPVYNGTTESEFNSGPRRRDRGLATPTNNVPAPAPAPSPGSQSDNNLFSYAELRSKQPSPQPSAQPSAQSTQSFAYPAPTGRSRVNRSYNPDPIQKKAQNIRCKKRPDRIPSSQIDINGERVDNTKYFKKPQRDYPAAKGSISLSGDGQFRPKPSSIRAVPGIVQDTDIFGAKGTGPPAVRHSLAPNNMGYGQTCGIFSNNAPTETRRNKRKVYNLPKSNPIL